MLKISIQKKYQIYMKYLLNNNLLEKSKTIVTLMPGFSVDKLGGSEKQAFKIMGGIDKGNYQFVILTQKPIPSNINLQWDGIQFKRMFSIIDIMFYPISLLILFPQKVKKYLHSRNYHSHTSFPKYTYKEKEYGQMLGLSDLIKALVFF